MLRRRGSGCVVEEWIQVRVQVKMRSRPAVGVLAGSGAEGNGVKFEVTSTVQNLGKGKW